MTVQSKLYHYIVEFITQAIYKTDDNCKITNRVNTPLWLQSLYFILRGTVLTAYTLCKVAYLDMGLVYTGVCIYEDND